MLAFAVVVLFYVAALVGYAENRTTQLALYGESLRALDEVETVVSISHFYGLHAYIVARVILIDGREMYYFVRDGQVRNFLEVTDMQPAQVLQSRALAEIGGGATTRGTQLGMHLGTAVLEVELEIDDVRHIVLVDAVTAEVILAFER